MARLSQIAILAVLLAAACSPSQQTTNVAASDSVSTVAVPDFVQKSYVAAIRDYIDTMFRTCKPDTIFINSENGTPAVVFPDQIDTVVIAMRRMDEIEALAKRRRTTVSLNMVGWPDTLKAEFILVTFFDYGRPQHNMHLFYSCANGNFTRDSLRIEYQYQNTIPLDQYLAR